MIWAVLLFVKLTLTPFFEMAEEITNINVAKAYVDHIIKTIKGD